MKFPSGNHLFVTLFAALLLPVCALGQSTPVPSKPFVPLEPPELFATLPPADTDWKIVESRARNVYSVWLMAVLTREYVGPVVPTPDAQGTKTADPIHAKTSITLSDTGAFAGFNGAFLASDTVPNRTTIGGFPALKDSPTAPGVESIQVWIAGRFIVKITTEHQPAGATAEWLKKIRTADLAAAAARGERTLANPLTMYKIDELNPKANRTYPLSWTTSEALEATGRP